MAPRAKKDDFEPALRRLEEIVAQLDTGGLPLDKAVALFEEGQKLASRCAGQLDAADAKIKLLIRAHEGRDERRTEIGPDDDIDAAIDDALDDEATGNDN